jgi:hypothetical protein
MIQDGDASRQATGAAEFRLAGLMIGIVLLLAALGLWAAFGGEVFARIGSDLWALCF